MLNSHFILEDFVRAGLPFSHHFCGFLILLFVLCVQEAGLHIFDGLTVLPLHAGLPLGHQAGLERLHFFGY